MNHKLLLIDGLNLLFKSHFGLSRKIPGRDGRSIHGTVGFFGILLRTLVRFQPTHLLAVFDHEEGSFRNNADANYKSNRSDDRFNESSDNNPHDQLEYIYSALDFLDWKHSETPDYEADDIIAAYVLNYEKEAEVIILSADSDLFQLVKSGVSVYCPRGKNSSLFGQKEVEDKFGLAPERIPDLKALAGDNSDNIIGIPGIGPQRAGALIRRFGCLQDIFLHLEEIESKAISNSLRTHQKQAFHNLSLTRLETDAPLPFALPELSITTQSCQYKTMQLLREAGVAAS